MSSMHGIPFEIHARPRFGLIGVGKRGQSLLHELLACEKAQVTAVADTSPEAVELACQRVTGAGRPAPAAFTGENAWRALLEEDLDMVYIVTPWDTHVPYAVAAMHAGKHVGLEVPAAVTLEECWQLVEASEQTRKHCVLLENCCYDYWEMLVRRMAAGGLFGTITHAECAYIHDLRKVLLTKTGEGPWWRAAHRSRNGNHYPTHGLGPVAQILGIGAEDAFDYLVSMSSLPAGLADYRDRVLAENDPMRQEDYLCGDMNVSLIRTRLGRTIVLQHSVTSPRLYDRIFLVSGTRGVFRGYPPRLHLDGAQEQPGWLPLEGYQAEWEDPLWKLFNTQGLAKSGHRGMDYIMTCRLVQCLREGLPPDNDVYDAVDWSAPVALSEESVRQRSMPVNFPDFRTGR